MSAEIPVVTESSEPTDATLAAGEIQPGQDGSPLGGVALTGVDQESLQTGFNFKHIKLSGADGVEPPTYVEEIVDKFRGVQSQGAVLSRAEKRAARAEDRAGLEQSQRNRDAFAQVAADQENRPDGEPPLSREELLAAAQAYEAGKNQALKQ